MDDKLSYSEIMRLATDLKVIAGQIDELAIVMKDDYSKIDYNGPMWSGDTAKDVKNTFNNAVEKVPNFVLQVSNYADAIVNDLIRSEDN